MALSTERTGLQGEVSFEEAQWEQMRKAYSDAEIVRILEILDSLPYGLNGMCGVEMHYSTIPTLLEARGIVPARSDYYSSRYRICLPPREDGHQAATPEQREIIRAALRRGGFLLEKVGVK